MNPRIADLVIIGAGPVGLMCTWLALRSGLSVAIADRSAGPLEKGRADALNARSLQLLDLAGLFDELYPQGKPCNTSSVWADGRFISRQSAWWDALEGCLHRHFLMLGQSHLEKLLDRKLREAGTPVRRLTHVTDIQVGPEGCLTTLSSGESIRSAYVIGADGSRSFVREHFKIPFEIERPQMTWAVIDGVVETDFPKAPEIVVFQAETSDVAWIPREGRLDRFYVRMDKKEFALDEAIAKINRAMSPHKLRFAEIDWSSQFTVKESVAESFSAHDRVFLAGDACHIHSVNGGQGLNTGLADAFNLVWKLARVKNHGAPSALLRTYEAERKPVAISVVETSAELVRATKYSASGDHARDYVRIVEKRAGHITGMGIRYPGPGLRGQRLHDRPILRDGRATRLYSLLDYSGYTLLLFGGGAPELASSGGTRILRVPSDERHPYKNLAILVRPDSYIESAVPLEEAQSLLEDVR